MASNYLFLVRADKIPTKFFPQIAQNGASRLQDKSAFVRKAAMQLLTQLLIHNPFGPSLQLKSYRDSLKETSKALVVYCLQCPESIVILDLKFVFSRSLPRRVSRSCSLPRRTRSVLRRIRSASVASATF